MIIETLIGIYIGCYIFSFLYHRHVRTKNKFVDPNNKSIGVSFLISLGGILPVVVYLFDAVYWEFKLYKK